MYSETKEWIASKTIDAIRRHEEFPQNAAYELGGMPFVDPLRKMVVPDDKTHILRMIQDGRWWHRYLGLSISRPILDQDIVDTVQSLWEQEEHFHTQLGMIYLLMHYGVPESDTRKMIVRLREDEGKFIECIHNFYGAHPHGTWGALCSRLGEPKFQNGQLLYLLALSILAETNGHKLEELPAIVLDLTHSNNTMIKELAVRLEQAVK